MAKTSSKRKKEIVEHLRIWLEHQDVFKNRQQMADYLHISPSHLGNIIAGVRFPSDDLAGKIKVMTGYHSKDKDENKNNSDRPYKDLADELQRWFHRQKRWKNQIEIAAFLGVDKSYVSKFFMGRMFPGGTTREKLYSITNIELLKVELSDQSNIKEKEIKKPFRTSDSKEIKKELLFIKETLQKIEKAVNSTNGEHKTTFENQNSVERIASSFYILAEELIQFQNSTIEERQALRKHISSKDIGFLISFLKAIYDEDKFSDFIFFAKYELEGGQ